MDYIEGPYIGLILMLRRRLLVSSIGMINRTRSGLWVITFENINSQGHEVLSTQRVSSNGAGEPAGVVGV